jgi:Asp/Glu/hydantoin racemase
VTKRVALIHTVSTLPAVFKPLCAELIPDADVFHIVDESLLQNTIRQGALTPLTCRRLAAYVISAEEAGAEAVMVTCSSVGPAVDLARPLVSVPVLRVDQPMADRAVRMGHRIGVAATLRTTLEPAAQLVQARAAAAGADVEVTAHLCEGAFEAVSAGDTARHDTLVAAGLAELMDRVDVIVLAQASMARVVDNLPAETRRVPILSSPRLGVEGLKALL